MPILIAPTALPGLAHPEGEVATTKAAGIAKTVMTLATLSTSSIEEAMAVATGPVWFQLYVFKDRDFTASLVQRAEEAGCKAMVLTVDVPMPGQRERDERNRFTLPVHLSMKNLLPAGRQKLPKNVAGSLPQSAEPATPLAAPPLCSPRQPLVGRSFAEHLHPSKQTRSPETFTH